VSRQRILRDRPQHLLVAPLEGLEPDAPPSQGLVEHYAAPMEVRPYRADDEESVRELAPRLLVGAAEWIAPKAMLATIHGWLDESLAGVAFVAIEADGLAGFVTVTERKHFTGVPEAYVGELAVAEDAEGRGVGRALMGAVEAWARERNLARISLDTGVANAGARGFYAALGYEETDVRLSKPLK
jgi:ribosomal protein S18 acetylase RimI-like enzyme